MSATPPQIRTCVGCGRRAARPELVRLKVSGGRVVLDPVATGGRGAWLHPVPACLDRAIERRALPRALRAPGVLADAGELRAGLTGNARKH